MDFLNGSEAIIISKLKTVKIGAICDNPSWAGGHCITLNIEEKHSSPKIYNLHSKIVVLVTLTTNFKNIFKEMCLPASTNL